MEASTYCIGLNEDASSLQHIYWGPHIEPEDTFEIAHTAKPLQASFESPTGISREEYAPWGELRFNEPDLKVTYADGTRGIEWLFEEYGIKRSGASQTLWLRFHDHSYPLRVILYYRIYDGHDVIERWVRLENSGGGGPITIEQALSADWRLPRRERFRLTYLYGQHMKETQVAEVTLGPGKVVLESRRGSTSHQFNPWVALDPDASATENSSEVWSTTLAWSGSWKIVVETTPYGEVHCAGGVNDFDFRYLWTKVPIWTCRPLSGYTQTKDLGASVAGGIPMNSNMYYLRHLKQCGQSYIIHGKRQLSRSMNTTR